jgi:rare lipoprotein A
MTKTSARRLGARVLAGLALAGLMASTPGLADTRQAEPSGPASALVAADVPPVVAEPVVITMPEPVEPEAEHIGDGRASYYGNELAGNRTANGERFNPQALTAAHRSLPFGTKLRVTNKANGKSVIVRINDRGPFVKKRVIDISLASARQINMVSAGEAMVRLERLR